MKITKTQYEALVGELKNRLNNLKDTAKSAELAGENARKVGNDDLADRCYERQASLKPQIERLEALIDEYDK